MTKNEDLPSDFDLEKIRPILNDDTFKRIFAQLAVGNLKTYIHTGNKLFLNVALQEAQDAGLSTHDLQTIYIALSGHE